MGRPCGSPLKLDESLPCAFQRSLMHGFVHDSDNAKAW
jgi:hypothetical protein